ncbi:S8 family serine peptidase [Streptomyces sp. B1866]|uniref:S8 family serine peptidase n=1 Tax=Streptomyces sp. B1866 TaxID=3075431 RepID=UPI00288CA37D|nr:S8 family serine peptidase [Streptomyces sp. B1866]MDT3397271.1 S8 family serine peptidase [Streptomyces sp. B1866]
MSAGIRRTAVIAALSTSAALGLFAAAVPSSAGVSPGPTAVAPADKPGPVNRLIVKYRSGLSSTVISGRISTSAKRQGHAARLQRRLADGAALVDLGARADAGAISAMRQAFAADPDVAYVERDQMLQPAAVPDDPEYGRQWNLYEQTGGMNVADAWTSTTGAGVTVAVIDTGYTAHSDLAANIVPGYDFISDAATARDGDGRDGNAADEGTWNTAGQCGFGSGETSSSWHGTHVAGIVGAVTNNGKGVAGVAPGVRIQPVRVLGACGGTTSDIADAITWASGGSVPGVPANPTPAKVLNLSLGGRAPCATTTQNAVDGAVSRGATVVVAAGNSNDDAANHTPANCANVVTVAASGRGGARASYSNYGASVDITAPGGDGSDRILSTLNTGTTTPGAETYKAYQGTSMATPHISGLSALLLARRPGLTPAQVESAIKAGARPLPGGCSGGCGAGLADAARSVAAPDAPQPAATVTVTKPSGQWALKGWQISPLQLTARASDGAPVTFTATGLPPGLTISSAGRISGTPTAAGAFTTTVTASASGASARTAFSWQVWGW